MPGTYFTGDNYAVSVDDTSGEAVIAVNGGSITDPLTSQQITFALEKNWFDALSTSTAARTLKVNPTITIDGIDVTEEALASTTNPVTWKIELFINSVLVPGCTFTSREFVLPSEACYEDIYELHVQATWNGISYDESFTVYGYDPS